MRQDVSPSANGVVARLVRIAEDLARVAADVVVMLHTPPAPVVIQTAVEHVTDRTAWTVAEFAESLGLHEDTVRRLLRSGDIRGFKVNGHWRISETERVRWVSDLERQTAEELGVA